MTGNNMILQLGLAFISGEKEEDYNWALDQLCEIMYNNSIPEPTTIVTDRELALIHGLGSRFTHSHHTLCQWHVNMNVLAKTKALFPGPMKHDGKVMRHPNFQKFLSDWSTLLKSPIEKLYHQQPRTMHFEYPIKAMAYVINTWLLWKENLVACWINQYFHFGVLVTSPIEGCHITLKSYLKRGHADLRGVYLN